MSVVRSRVLIGLCALVAAAACGDGGTNPGNGASATPALLTIVSGNGQTGLVGQQLAIPLVVRVVASTGASVGNATVAFAVTAGAATVSPTSVTTDTSGLASTAVTLGSTTGTVTITATVVGTTIAATFSATAGSGTIQTACTGAAPQTPAVGGVLPSVSGTGVCLGGGASGADYAIVAFNSNPDSELVTADFTVRGSGIATLTSADRVPAGVSLSRTTGAAPAAGAALYSRLAVRKRDVRTAFDLHLREVAARELTPRIDGARRAYAAAARSSARFDVIPSGTPTKGQIWRLNANGTDACTNANMVGAKVVAVSTTAIIVADTLNPTQNGFTDADYASFAARFDTLVNPLDVGNFGSPTDIDKNGRIVIFVTKEVNKLTPRGSAGFIGGFFFERDLFPTTDNTQLGLQGCAGSNYGEIFYVLAPDSLGQFSDARRKSDVVNNTTGTLAHEYQHLINAGRRLYVNNAPVFETVWLNEGLSHIAEELLYYRVSGLGPRQNLGIDQVRANSVDAFNEFQADNLGRYQVFIGMPPVTDVYGDNDSLETRGATWNLLRYLADHRGSADGDVWQQLDNTRLAGQENLAHVFGSDYMTQIRNWSTSVFSDDVAGVTDARFLEPSWNMRSLFPQLCVDNRTPCTKLGIFPIEMTSLVNNQTATQSIVAGGSSYLRFSVPAGSQGSIDWSTGGFPVTPFVQFTVVRTR